MKGNVAWTWLSSFLNNKPLHYFEVMTNIGLYVLESLEAYNGNINLTANIEKTNNLYLFDLQNRNSRVLKNFEVITESPPPVITRDGHLLALPSDARARRYLLKLDVTGNVVRVLSPPCKVGQLCKIVDFKPTLDGGLILTLEINDENYIRPQTKIVKWMNTDLGR